MKAIDNEKKASELLKEIKILTGLDRNKVFVLSLSLILELLNEKELMYSMSENKFYIPELLKVK
jgi:hypothetical protein